MIFELICNSQQILINRVPIGCRDGIVLKLFGRKGKQILQRFLNFFFFIFLLLLLEVIANLILCCFFYKLNLGVVAICNILFVESLTIQNSVDVLQHLL